MKWIQCLFLGHKWQRITSLSHPAIDCVECERCGKRDKFIGWIPPIKGAK